MDGGGHGVARCFVGTDGVHLITQHTQRLKGHHGLVVLREIAAQQQNFFDITGTSINLFRKRFRYSYKVKNRESSLTIQSSTSTILI